MFRLAAARGGPSRALRTLRSAARLAGAARTGGLRRFVRIGDAYTWDLYAPFFPSTAFDRFAGRELDRLEAAEPRPQTVVFAITRRCGLSCEHCFEWKDLNKPEALSGMGLRTSLQALLRLGVTQVFFSGGEPLARLADLLELVRLAGRDVQCWVITSGAGLGEPTARRLGEAGVVGVVLSLDDWDAARHDAFRGKPGTFDGLVRAAGHARDAGLAVALGLCPTRQFTTAANLERYGQVAAELGAVFIQILEPHPRGRYEGRDVMLGEREQSVLEQFYERLCFGTGLDERLPVVSYPELVARRMGCQGAGKRYLYVDTEGGAHACPFCGEAAGNLVNDEPFAVLALLGDRGCPRDSCGSPGGSLC